MSKSLAQMNINFREQKEVSTRIRELKERTDRCVCRFCGETLSLRKITYAAYDEAKIDIFCDHCDRIEYGVEPEIYLVAEYFVDEMKYDHYSDLDDSVHKRRMNIAIICDILMWGYKNTGILCKDGFTVPLQFNQDLLGEALTISDKSLRALEEV